MAVDQSTKLGNPQSKIKSLKRKKKNKNKFAVQENQITSTTNENVAKSTEHDTSHINLDTLWKTYKKRSTVMIKVSNNWTSDLITEGNKVDPTSVEDKRQLRELAIQILKDDVETLKKVQLKNKQYQFQINMINKGTTRDRMAAHVLRCMEAPVHSIANLRSLIDMVKTNKKNFSDFLHSLEELFKVTLLPDGQSTKKFEQHNFSSLLPLIVVKREQAYKQIVLWYFEEQLGVYYNALIRELTYLSKDNAEKTKSTAIKYLISFATNHPGQNTECVLKAIVNKLGDPSKKVAAQTIYVLRSLLHARRNLKMEVVCLVEELLFRTNVSEKTKFYSLCFLKDIIFTQEDYKIAEKLVKIYFGFFRAYSKKGEVDTRLMGALLRGLNRAFPYLSSEGKKSVDEQLNTLYTLVHVVNFVVATQALQLIYQVLGNQTSDRFYQSLYKKIQDPELAKTSACPAFLNLLFKAMCKDESITRIQAFIKRLFQTCLYLDPSIVCGIIYLISEIMKEKPALKDFKEPMLSVESMEDDESDTEVYPDLDVDEFGNVIKPQIKDEDNKDDVFKDNKGWVHRRSSSTGDKYDPYHRNPLHCGAEKSTLYELQTIINHFHPSVKLYANNVLLGIPIKCNGDPLIDFTLMKFLDKFVYKNPKKMSNKCESVDGHILGRRKVYAPKGARGMVVNTAEFKNLKQDDVPEDQLFFHKFFNEFHVQKEKDSDTESIGDDEFDKYLMKMHGGDPDADMDLDFASSAKNKDGLEAPSDEDFDDFSGDEEMGEDEEDNDDMPEDIDGEDGDMQDWGDMSDDGDELGGIDSDDSLPLLSDDDAQFDDSDEDEPKPKKSKSLKKSSISKIKKKYKSASDFADADDFASIMEENADLNNVAITSTAVYNKDKSSAKQLKWEDDRERFMKNKRWNKNKQGRFKGKPIKKRK